MTKIKAKDWRNLPIDKWNTTTVHAFLIDETDRRYGKEYVPGGKGPRSKRWSAEKGMIKHELDKRGPEVVRKFIEICWNEYFTSDPEKYPYPTFGFMKGFMDKYWTKANEEVDEKRKRSEIAERSDLGENITELEEWF
jgi:hypothetical protein